MSLNCKGSGIEFGHLAEVFFTPTPALNIDQIRMTEAMHRDCIIKRAYSTN